MEISTESILKIKALGIKNNIGKDKFVDSVFFEDQYVGIGNDNNSVIAISFEEISDMGLCYADLNQQLKDFKFYKHKVGGLGSNNAEENIKLIERHQETMLRKNIIEKKNTRTAINSVRGADGRKF